MSGDLCGLDPDLALQRGDEDEPEVEVGVSRFTFRRVGGNRVHVDVERRSAEVPQRFDGFGRQAGLLVSPK